MQKFAHIESLKTARQVAQRNNPSIGCVLYRGTVKLHGCNAGVICTPERLAPQSRNRPLSVEDDHMGFAAFVAAHELDIRVVESEIRRQVGLPQEVPLALFGEWIGPGIQRKVAISSLPERQWVLFAFADVSGQEPSYLEANPTARGRIRSVREAGTWEVEIDFLDWRTADAHAQIAAWTEPVDHQCPWGTLHGLEGPGEGIVWVPLGEHAGRMDLAFKSKGSAHREVGPLPEHATAKDDERTYLQRVAESLCPEARLAKGLDFLRESKLPIARTSLGPYLKWVSQDVLRECAEEIAEAGVEWKRLSGPIVACARGFFERALRDSE